MALKYNEGLKSMLKGLKSELKGDMNYSYVDVYGIFDSFIRTPSIFGTSTQFFSLFYQLVYEMKYVPTGGDKIDEGKV